MMARLRWEEQYPGSWYAYSGELVVGMVVTRMDDTIGYTLDAVRTKYITKGYGDAGSVAQGKRSLARAWHAWLKHAGLVR